MGKKIEIGFGRGVECEYCSSRLHLTHKIIKEDFIECPVCKKKLKTLRMSSSVLCPVCEFELELSEEQLAGEIIHCVVCTSKFLLLPIDEEEP